MADMTTRAEADLVLASTQGQVGRIELNRHRKRNAINGELADAFQAGVDRLSGDGVRVCVLAAAGTVFSAGADLAGAGTGSAEQAPTERICAAVRTAPFLWIAAVQGGCSGAGVAVALCCPVVVAAEDAWFQLPELSKLRRMPVGVIRRLAPVLGPRAAIGLAVGEQRVTAGEALAAGWLTTVVPADSLAATVASYATKLAAAAPESIDHCVELWRDNAEPG
jgi:enoyl-CoA hydratase/carnithine racemase